MQQMLHPFLLTCMQLVLLLLLPVMMLMLLLLLLLAYPCRLAVSVQLFLRELLLLLQHQLGRC